MSHNAMVMVNRISERLCLSKVLDGPPVQAAGTTVAEAVGQIKRALQDVAKHEPYVQWSSIERSELKYVDLKVRLFYRDGKRRFPASDLIKLPVCYVLGHYDDGSVECFLPDWDSAFFCPEMEELHSLLTETVRGAVSGISPEELRRRTPVGDRQLQIVRVKEFKQVRRGETESSKTLRSVARRLGERSRREKSEAAFERDSEIQSLVQQVLTTRHNLLLVGPTGCGKSTILNAVARNILKHKAYFDGNKNQATADEFGFDDDVNLKSPQLWETSAAKLIAGMQFLGEWEARLEEVIAELEQINGILCIESLSELVRQGGTDATDSIAAFMRSFVSEGRLRLIAESTPEGLSAVRGLLPGFAESFQICRVDALGHDATRRIVQRVLRQAERDDKFKIDPEISELIPRLFARFLPYEVPPGGPVKLVRRMLRQVKVLGTGDLKLTKNDALESFSTHTGLPEAIVQDQRCSSEAELTALFSRQVLGQPEGVEAAVKSVMRLTSGLNDPKRPIQTLIFAGPTGVGKTQMARSLADHLFAAREPASRMIRLDMSEYAGFGGVDRFLMNNSGEPAGWIQKLRINPLAVLLLDEIEKASQDVFDSLLAALDEGRISDRFGRTTTLCGCIIIMTSNIGATATTFSGFEASEKYNPVEQRQYYRAMRETFRPEFLNRIDRIVTFRGLSNELMESLVRKELNDLQARESLTSRRIKLRWSDELVTSLAQAGFDPLMGARPLQRRIEQTIVAPLAAFLLGHDDVSEIYLDDLVLGF